MAFCGVLSPGGESPGTPESLPSPEPPSGVSATERKRMEDNMVAVKDLVGKALKYVPSNIKWDGTSQTFDMFLALASDYVEIDLGETAVQVLMGKRTTMAGLPIPSYMYATWSVRLYMVLMGRLDTKGEHSASATAVMNATIDNRVEIKRSAFNLICFWRSLGQVVTEQDCVAIDFKIKALRVDLEDAPEVVVNKLSGARRLHMRKPEGFRGGEATIEGVLLNLLPQQCDPWKTHYKQMIDGNASLYGTPRPKYDALVVAIQAAVLSAQIMSHESKVAGHALLVGHRGGPRACLNCKSTEHETTECDKTCTAGPGCKRVYCGFNVTGVCPIKSGVFPERIMNAAGRPIPLHLYLKVKDDFDKVHGGRVRGVPDTEEPAAPQVGAGASSLLLCDDGDMFFSQRVDGMTM